MAKHDILIFNNYINLKIAMFMILYLQVNIISRKAIIIAVVKI